MAGAKLSKIMVLRNRTDFDRLFTQGRRRSGQFVHIHFLQLPEGSSPRVAFIVGKKIGPAVTRNLWKRRFREIFRLHQTLFAGYEVLIIAQISVLKADFHSVSDDILETISTITRQKQS
ncbi:ribonuclease P protein component [bacterium]|nr:ribonuclease P protein component [bacterium]